MAGKIPCFVNWFIFNDIRISPEKKVSEILLILPAFPPIRKDAELIDYTLT